jgi:hypothetical protein
MPLQKLQFKPGVNRDQTNYTNEGGWFQCDKIRFRSGYPQKIGGWLRYGTFTIIGICRQMFNWVTTQSDNYLAMGTSKKVYLEAGTEVYDITPLQHTSTTLGAAAGPFTATSGSSTLTVSYSTDTAYNPEVGNYVTFTGAATLGGNITALVLNAEFGYEILTVNTSAKTYTINVGVNANGSDTGKGGATVTAAYDIDVGYDVDVFGYGWGAGAWGRLGWGSGAVTPVVLQQRDWFFNNFDNDLVMNIRNGPIYYWERSAGVTSRAALLSATTINGIAPADVPTEATEILVSQNDKHLICFGATPFGGGTFDPLLIRWATQDQPNVWTPLVTNSAGFIRLSRGSKIVCAITTRQEILVYTEGTINSFQFLGTTDVFGVQELADNISILSPRAVAVVNNVAYWMGKDKFYAYSGRVETLPSTLRNHVFTNLNFAQADQIISGTNEGWNEVWWFYPTANSQVNDAYVVYNHLEKIWYYGTINRTAWLDSPVREYPQAVGDNKLYNHELGSNDDTLPLLANIASSDFDLVDGDQFILTKRIIPDISFSGSTAATPTATMYIKPRNFPGNAYTNTESQNVIETSVDVYTEQIFMRARARQMAIEIASTDLNVQWQLGSPRLDGRPDGRR